MLTAYDIIRTILRTEKGTSLEAQRKYFFEVDTRSTKADIKRAVETIYKVKVRDVHTIMIPGKRKRVRHEYGYTTSWKKAIVTLQEGQKIETT